MKNKNKELKLRFLDSTQLRASSIEDGKLRTGPEFVRIGVSHACNFNCLTCWNYSPLLNKKIPQTEKIIKIDKNLVFNLIDDLAEMQCIRILFSGIGEPFTHPDMMKFIKRARDKNILVYIQTNLSLVKNTNQLAKYLGGATNLVCVHLSAINPEVYVKMHPNQKKKDFFEILRKIKVLVNKKVPVRLVYVVNKFNYKEIPEALKLNEDLKTRLHLEMMDYDSKNGLGVIALNNIEKKNIIKNLSNLKKNKKYILNTNISDFINQLTHSALGIKKLDSCSVGYFFSTINETGCVDYCFNRHKKLFIGDLNKRSFKDIWNSKKYHDLRIRLAKGNFLDVCQNCIKKRGYNFKIRMYTNPKVRNFKSDAEILDYYNL